MKEVVKGLSWVALAVVTGLIIAPLVKNPAELQATNTFAIQNTPALKTANEISDAFRQVSQQILPSVVTITTWSKETPSSASQNGTAQLEELFKSDPRFRQLFGDDLDGVMPQQGRGPSRQRPRAVGQGSGFVISNDGYIITNAHVVNGAGEILVRFADGQEAYATETKVDERSDVAILKIEGVENLQALKFADSKQVEVGDWVLAIGNPFGLDLSVSAGIISGKGRAPNINEREDYIQTDAAVNPGNSGGPLVNLHGEVVGINVAISSRSGGYDGVAFAIPADLAKWVSDQLLTKGSVERTYLGVVIQPLTQSIARQFGTKTNDGALVSQVGDNSPADKAGIKAGDIIQKVNGESVNSTLSLQGIVEKLAAGQSYDVVILRDKKMETVSVKMEVMPNVYSMTSRGSELAPSNTKDDQPDSVKDTRLGIEVQEITASVAKQMNLKSSNGVVITKVENGSPVIDLGLNVGAVILKYGSHDVNNQKDYEEAMKNTAQEKEILLRIHSGNSTKFLIVRPHN
jgi:serine protease Do